MFVRPSGPSLSKYCVLFMLFSYFQVCTGLIGSFGPDVYMVMKSTNQAPENICGFMFGEACDNPVSQSKEILEFPLYSQLSVGQSHARVELLDASPEQ